MLEIFELNQIRKLTAVVREAKQELERLGAVASAAEEEARARQAGMSELRRADRLRFLLECRERCGPGSGPWIAAIEKRIADAMRESSETTEAAAEIEATTDKRTHECQ